MDRLLKETVAPVIVPLDGSREAERALSLAEAFARQHHRVLLLVHVAVPVSCIGLEPTYALSADYLSSCAAQGRRYLEATRRRLARHGGLVVQTMELTGGAAGEVARLAEAHPGALVVMTTHGRGHVASLLLGSVAAELIGVTTVPLLIMPPVGPLSAEESIMADGVTAPIGGAPDLPPAPHA